MYTRSTILPLSDYGVVFDEYRKTDKVITFCGLTIWKKTTVHNFNYPEVEIEVQTKPIGFVKPK
jgi:hypothetical protein